MISGIIKRIKKRPILAVIAATGAVIAFILSSSQQALNLVSVISETSKIPKARISVLAPDGYTTISNVKSSKIMRIPENSEDYIIRWLTIPIRAELINPKPIPVTFRNIELAYIDKEKEKLEECKNPNFSNGTNHVGFYTWILKDKAINPDEDLNIPINLPAHTSKIFYIDFLTVPLIPEIFEKSKNINMNEFDTYCLRWIDNNGNRYVSDIYYSLDYSSNK